jgi:hypothetical protein
LQSERSRRLVSTGRWRSLLLSSSEKFDQFAVKEDHVFTSRSDAVGLLDDPPIDSVNP